MDYFTPSIVKRFWAKVRKTDGCWYWEGGKTGKGYGAFSVTSRKIVLAHRYSFELEHGFLDPKILVLHTCDNHPCIRPDHLFSGTHADNMQDMVQKGRSLTGDRNPMRLYPEKRLTGDQHWTHQHPELVSRGVRSGGKLTDEKVREIRTRRAGGDSWTDLMHDFNISRSMLANVLSYKNWKHVE